MDTNRAIAGFYFHRLLCRVFNDEDCRFILKGGQGMLAKTIDARYTRDIDLLAKGSDLQAALAELEELASIDLGDHVRFEFEKASPIKLEDEYRGGCTVTFSAWMGAKMVQAVSIDLVVDLVEGVSAERVIPVDRVEVEGIRTVSYMVYGVEDALADKLFGIAEKHDGRHSSRVKDLVDTVIYASSCTIDGDALAAKLRRESALRGVVLPVSFSVPIEWRESYRPMFGKLYRQTGIDSEFRELDSAEGLAKRLFDPILGSPVVVRKWSPSKLEWER
ncbi:MAG: nucleotidyl transferase AbiEii/AbiGii toxin family protein [Eggerthellaceae bacterium]